MASIPLNVSIYKRNCMDQLIQKLGERKKDQRKKCARVEHMYLKRYVDGENSGSGCLASGLVHVMCA